MRVTDMIAAQDELALVMDLVRGPSLEQVLVSERPGPWSLDDALVVLRPVLETLAHAHGRQVVHRDLKPANILMERSNSGAGDLGAPKVTDFDLAKVLSSVDGITQAGSRMGTVPYMAPEQFRGLKDIDARADVFALAMILYRLLRGRLPVDPDDMVAVLSIYTGQAPLEPLGPSVGEPAVDTLMAALHIDPAMRPADAGELLARLEASSAGHGTFENGENDTPASPVAPERAAPVSKPATARPTRGRRARLAARRRASEGGSDRQRESTKSPTPSTSEVVESRHDHRELESRQTSPMPVAAVDTGRVWFGAGARRFVAAVACAWFVPSAVSIEIEAPKLGIVAGTLAGVALGLAGRSLTPPSARCSCRQAPAGFGPVCRRTSCSWSGWGRCWRSRSCLPRDRDVASRAASPAARGAHD